VFVADRTLVHRECEGDEFADSRMESNKAAGRDVGLICAVLTAASFYVIVFPPQLICGPPPEGQRIKLRESIQDAPSKRARKGVLMLSIRVLVASHIRLYREGLERVLRESPELTLEASVGSAPEAIEQTRKLGADVVLLDMAMSGAFYVAKEMERAGGPSKVVALGTLEDETQVLSCAQMGIVGYVTRDGSVEDVVAAIKAAVRGEAHCSPKVAGSLFRRIAAMATAGSQRKGNGVLTARETQILHLLQEGMSNKMISRVLGIELATVKNHVHRVLAKLDIHRRAEAVSLLYRPVTEKRSKRDEN
jgi:two-component system, NarL family, nitrate/nitrite response regulator NarL